jgi:hypothetical protein
MAQQQGELGIERLCELARISRAGYYRHWQHTTPGEVDVELRDQLQNICLAHRHYGETQQRARPSWAVRNLAQSGLADQVWRAE